MDTDTQRLRSKIQAQIETLPPERIAEIGDFVDFIAKREHDRATASESALRSATSALNTKSFERVWDNPDDAVYDDL